jgi:seryl-tRNA synthetase
MIDINFLKSNPDAVRENIKKKFQDHKLPLVDEVLELDTLRRETIGEVEALKANKNKLSKENGMLFGKMKKSDSDTEKAELQTQIDKNSEAVKATDGEISSLEEKLLGVEKRIREIMLTIPNIIADDVPIGPDDSHNVEIERFGEPVVPDFEVPYHTDIMAKFDGIDLEAAGRVAGNGFYYLCGDIARLHSSILSYARDFMIDRGFTYCIPPYMIRSNIVDGVMSFAEMDAMMYKIEGEDLFLIGTSEHSMIGRFVDQIIPEEKLPQSLTSFSPCFRKEKGAHGIEERGVYRIHQFEKQEMIVICNPEESAKWYDILWKNTVDFFRTLDIPVRTLGCCSGDLADLKVKSLDVEAWSPRQKKYFEVGSCSNLGDAQARRLNIKYKTPDKQKHFAHTLNNTVVAPPRMLIAFLENNINEDGSIRIPKALQPYMRKEVIAVPEKK